MLHISCCACSWCCCSVMQRRDVGPSSKGPVSLTAIFGEVDTAARTAPPGRIPQTLQAYRCHCTDVKTSLSRHLAKVILNSAQSDTMKSLCNTTFVLADDQVQESCHWMIDPQHA